MTVTVTVSLTPVSPLTKNVDPLVSSSDPEAGQRPAGCCKHSGGYKTQFLGKEGQTSPTLRPCRTSTTYVVSFKIQILKLKLRV